MAGWHATDLHFGADSGHVSDTVRSLPNWTPTPASSFASTPAYPADTELLTDTEIDSVHDKAGEMEHSRGSGFISLAGQSFGVYLQQLPHSNSKPDPGNDVNVPA